MRWTVRFGEAGQSRGTAGGFHKARPTWPILCEGANLFTDFSLPAIRVSVNNYLPLLRRKLFVMQLVINSLQRGLHLSSWREPRGLAALVLAVVLPVLGSACTPALPMPMSDLTDPLFVSVCVFLQPARKTPCSGGCLCP